MFLGADPAKDGKADLAGMTAGYTQFFGTKEQPQAGAHHATGGSAAASSGALVDIDLVAGRPD